MPITESVIRDLESFISDFKPYAGNKSDWQKVYNARDVLKKYDNTHCKNCLHFTRNNIPADGCGFCNLLERVFEGDIDYCSYFTGGKQ